MSTVASSLGDARRLQGQGPRSGRQLPFEGLTYYLDLPTYAGQRRLERDIVCMGGKVDKFLSNQVTHVVTSKSTVSPGRRDSAGSTPEPAVLSRGLALLKLSGRIQSSAGGKSGVAARARQLGVAVVTLADILDQIARHVETHAELAHAHPIIAHNAGKTVVRRLRGVFMKIEDECDRFRPLMQRFQSFPAIVADSTHDMSPFYNSQRVKATVKNVEAARCSSKSVTLTSTKAVQKKTFRKEGFCECCDVCFDDEQQHRRSEAHQQYANCDGNYAPLDDVISKLSSIEHLLSGFHSVPTDLDCLHNTVCHPDVTTLTPCENTVDPENPTQLTDDSMCDKAVTKDENNNSSTNTTCNTESVANMLQEKHSLPDNGDVGEMQDTLSLSVTQQCLTQAQFSTANETEESTDEYDIIAPDTGDAVCVISSRSRACVDRLRVNQCDCLTCSEADTRLTVQQTRDMTTDIQIVDGGDIKSAILQEDNIGKTETETVDTGQCDPTKVTDQHFTITICNADVNQREADTRMAEYTVPRVLLQDNDVGEVGCTDVSQTKTVDHTSFTNAINERVREVSDMSDSDVYNTTEATRCCKDADDFDVSSCDVSRENRDIHSSTLKHNDRDCVMTHDVPITELALSDVNIYKMLDANFETPAPQLLSIGDLPVSSSNIELDACAEYPSLTHLLEVVDDFQTLCLDGNVITDYLNDTSTSEVDVVTVDGDISEREQSTLTPRCALCRRSGYASCCCAEDRSSNGTIDYDLRTSSLFQRELSDVVGRHASPIVLPILTQVAPTETYVTTFNTYSSERIRSPDSESLRSRWVNSFCQPGGLSVDVTERKLCTNVVESTGGDICQTANAANVAAESSTETVSLTGTRTVAPCSQDNEDTSCSELSPTQTSDPQKCELQNVGSVAADHWMVTPSEGMSVKLSRVAVTPCRSDDELTWSVEKCGDCSLRFSVNKQHLPPAADTNYGVTSVSREPTKRRKLF